MSVSIVSTVSYDCESAGARRSEAVTNGPHSLHMLKRSFIGSRNVMGTFSLPDCGSPPGKDAGLPSMLQYSANEMYLASPYTPAHRSPRGECHS